MGRTVRRIISVLPALAIQVLLLVALIRWLSPYAAVINFILSVLSILLVLYIIIKREESAYKTLWLLVILPFPLAGGLAAATPHETPDDSAIFCKIRAEEPRLAQTFAYLRKKTGSPVLANESAKYYPLGDDMFPNMLRDMESAEKFIYAEYFIIHHGEMFDAMLDVMRRKVRDGVDVRVIYDDLGSISTFSARDRRELVEAGSPWAERSTTATTRRSSP